MLPSVKGSWGSRFRARRCSIAGTVPLMSASRLSRARAISSLISVPIFQQGGEVLGVLNVSHPRASFFTEWHERLLVVYCNCLGQLIVNHRLVSDMDREIEKRTSLLVRTLEEVRTAEQGAPGE
ncbi:MAG: GAF domain-containing protein [Candidatus Moduliflexus flocculans]|nr:GAF domain-containing protein [Candidatus Moduliflexus flocculans]